MTETDGQPQPWPVHCPFASDGQCPTDPPCPSPRERVCVNGLGDE